MTTSQEIKELAEALALAQAEITNPAADEMNPYYGSTYADLAGGLNVIRGPLSKQGLSITQIVETEFKAPAFPGAPFAFVNVLTRLMHKTGQYIETTLQLPVVKQKKRDSGDEQAVEGIPTSQNFAAAATYGRRIAAFAICGIAKEGEDDDGNGSSGKGDSPKKGTRPAAQSAPRPAAAAPAAPAPPAPAANGKPAMSVRIKTLRANVIITEEEHKEIGAMIPKLQGADLEKFIAGWEKDAEERAKKGAEA